MKKGIFKNTLIIFLLSITAFSLFKYLSLLNENYGLENNLQQTRERIALLETEKQNLLKDLQKEKELQAPLCSKVTVLKENLRASNLRLTKLFLENDYAEGAIGQLNSEVSGLQEKNRLLSEENSRIFQEKQTLLSRLNSVDDLKKTIRELKKAKRQGKKRVKVSGLSRKMEIREEASFKEAMRGNNGFLIKDGRSTYPAKIRIEVIPAS
jgi:chromosome segregation ATPase